MWKLAKKWKELLMCLNPYMVFIWNILLNLNILCWVGLGATIKLGLLRDFQYPIGSNTVFSLCAGRIVVIQQEKK